MWVLTIRYSSAVSESDPYRQNASGGECSSEQFYAYTNSAMNYGHIAAHMLNAQVQVNAYSGLGMERHYNGNTTYEKFPVYYGRVIQNDGGVLFDPQTYQPDVVVIMLGTNDFSMAINAGETYCVSGSCSGTFPQNDADVQALATAYRASYHKFLAMQRAVHPNAKFVIGATNLSFDGAGDIFKQQAQLVVDEEKAAGHNDVYYKVFANMTGYGCAWHPGWALHRTWAKELAFQIDDDNITDWTASLSDLKWADHSWEIP